MPTFHNKGNMYLPTVNQEEFGFENNNSIEEFGFPANTATSANTSNPPEEETFGFPANTATLTNISGNFEFNLHANKNEPITIVSDTEGFNPKTQIEKIMAAEKLIYLGDLLDYTTNYNTNKVEPSSVAKENLCSLKLLQHFNNNPHVKSVLGNREFNKVKFWPLLQINNKGSSVNWWKPDNNNNNILDIAMNLCAVLKPCSEGSEYKWAIENLQSFCPFWRYNKSIKDNQDFKWKFEQRWGINESNNGTVIPKTLYERYEYLFGADPPPSNADPIGTIGAQNTHLCLPRELGYTDEKLTEIVTNKQIISIDELRAAIVFTVYARMLDISLYEDKKDKKHGINYSNDQSNDLYLDGVLANYLVKTPCVGYIDGLKGFYLFAHGGISLEFINKDVVSLFNEIKSVFIENDHNLCKHRKFSQSGGNIIQYADFINKINKFNEEVSKLMLILLNDPTLIYNIAQNALNVLITLCVPENDIIKTSGYTPKMSPIVSGLPIQVDILKNVNTGGKDVYTFFGHIPNGCGYGFYKIGDNQYSITTDFSASLFSSNIIFGKNKEAVESYNGNNLLLKLDTQKDELKLDGDIHIVINKDFIKLAQFTIENTVSKIFEKNYKAGEFNASKEAEKYIAAFASGVRICHTENIIKYDSLNIKFINNIPIQKTLSYFNKLIINNSNIVFHGTANVSVFFKEKKLISFEAEIFSVKNSFHKELVILNKLLLSEYIIENEYSFLNSLNNGSSAYKAANQGPLTTKGGSRTRLSSKRIHKRNARKSKLRQNKLKLKTRINKRLNHKNHTRRNTSKA